jgi:hypothetical protein
MLLYIIEGLCMNWDYERKAEKENELQYKLSQLLVSEGVDSSDSEIVAKELIKSITRISPPEEESRYIEFITAKSFSGAGGGKSTKPGNIRLNLNQLFGGLASGSLVFSGVTGAIAPWALVAAAIAFWSSIRGITSINVTENDIGVLWTLWKLRNTEGIVNESEQEILSATNNHLEKYGRNSIGVADVNAALNHLKEIRSIKPASNGGWFIVEWVRINYK